MTTQIQAATRLRAASSSSAQQLKSDAALLAKLALTDVKPDTSAGFAYVLVQDEPTDVVRTLKSKKWVGKPAAGVNAFHLTNPSFPGVLLEVTFAEDLEEDELDQWDLDEDGPTAQVAVIKA